MGYYVTMEPVTFESKLTPEEMKNKIGELESSILSSVIGYEDDGADFSINRDVGPGNRNFYELVPY